MGRINYIRLSKNQAPSVFGPFEFRKIQFNIHNEALQF